MTEDTSRRDRVLSICDELYDLGVPMEALAPILHSVDDRYCESCGRVRTTDDDWMDANIDPGDRDDLCWGIAANCDGIPFEGPRGILP